MYYCAALTITDLKMLTAKHFNVLLVVPKTASLHTQTNLVPIVTHYHTVANQILLASHASRA